MYSQKDIEKAKSVDLIEFTTDKGYDLKPDGKSSYRVVGYGGLIISENFYKHFSENQGGDTIDFCIKVLGWDFKKAVKELLEFDKVNENKEKKAGLEKKISMYDVRLNNNFELPERNQDDGRAIAYLSKTRGIKYELIKILLKKVLLYQDIRNNCVFPCYDKKGYPRGALLRGTNTNIPFKGRSKGSTTLYGWLWHPESESKSVIVTESPIDAISLFQLLPDSKKRYMLALGGLHLPAVERFLDDYNNIKQIIVLFDNDEQGIKGAEKLKKNFEEEYKINIRHPEGKKDWNEVLIARNKKMS